MLELTKKLLVRCVAIGGAAITFFSATGCSPKQKDAGDVIYIGEFASLTGPTASFGTGSHNGTLMALEEINANGGVLGKQIVLITEDNQSRAGESSLVVEKLISRDKVIAIIGEVASSRSLEAAPVCQEHSIPMITPSSTNPAVTQTGDYVFRTCFIDPFQGIVMGKFALDSLKAKRIAVLTDVRQDYSVGLAQFFIRYVQENGGTIVSDQKYSSGDKDFRAQLTAIKNTNPDVIFIPGYYTEIGLIARQARDLGIQVPLLGGDGWDGNTLLEIGGSALENTYYSNHFSHEDQDPQIQNFVTRYKEKYGTPPDAFAALGYDALKILVAAIERAGTTESKALRDAIASTNGYQGVTGLITLNEHRDAEKPAVILKYKDGGFVYEETIAP
jgi:branched-chain amino acid transport system substrate-binding protein